LEPLGGNMYAESASSGAPNAGAPGRHRPRHAAPGLHWRAATSTWWRSWSTMIATQRAYEMNSKAIQTSDQMLQKLGQI
jgi:flagellar basal-body rod protein FlgG